MCGEDGMGRLKLWIDSRAVAVSGAGLPSCLCYDDCETYVIVR